MSKTKPTPKENAEEQLMHATRRFTRSTLMMQSAIAGKAGLNVTDAECIDFLMEMGPSTAGDLARATQLTTGAITSMIDRLEKAGLVQRERDATDRRKVIVRFLPAKHEQTGKYYTAMAKDVKSFLKKYTQKELAFLTRHVEGLQAIFDKHTQQVIASDKDT